MHSTASLFQAICANVVFATMPFQGGFVFTDLQAKPPPPYH
jgi:hypothetical protein